MKHNSQVSTEGHFKSYGGETLSRLKEGALFGAGFGFLIAIILYLFLRSRSFAFYAEDSTLSEPALFFILTAASMVFGALAGAFIGIGVPRLKILPKQGLVKKWRHVDKSSSSIPAEDKDKEIFVPEKLRETQKNNNSYLEY